MHAQVHVNVKCLCGCMRACDSAEATRIVLRHISAHVLGEKKSRPSGWFVVQTNPSQKLLAGLGKKKRQLYCFCQRETRTKATTRSLAACPLCKAV